MASLLEIGLSNAAMAALLAVLASGLTRVYRRPAFAHGLWLVVLLKLVTPPFVPVPLPWFGPREPAEPAAEATLAVVLTGVDMLTPEDAPDEAGPDAPGVPAIVTAGAAPKEGTESGFLPGSWRLPVLLAWAACSLCGLAWLVRSVVLFRRVLWFAWKAGPEFQEVVQQLAGKIGLARPPEVWLVPGKISPMLWALGGRPRLLFPAQLLERLERAQLRSIFLHELAHGRRRDHWVRLLELAVLVLYWWHPAVWLARAELREAEEQCCDAWVVGILEGAERTYALALLETVAFLSKARLPLPVAASGIGQVSHLRRRLTMIMNGQNRRSLTWAGCAGLLAFGLLLLPLIPVRGQQPPKKEASGTIVFQLDGPLELLLGGDPSPDQEAIELLKRALKILAEKKQAKGAEKWQRADPAARPTDSEEVKKARAQVDTLAGQLANQRRDLQLTEARLRQAEARLAELQGKPAVGLPLRFQMKLEPDPAGKKGWVIESREKVPVPATREKVLAPATVPAPKAQPDDLKSRLDRLLREVEELRREIERKPG